MLAAMHEAIKTDQTSLAKPLLPFDRGEDIHGNTMIKWLLVSHDKYTPHGRDDCPYCLNYDCSIQCPFKRDFGIEKGCMNDRSPYSKYMTANSSKLDQKRAALEMAMYSSQFVRGRAKTIKGKQSAKALGHKVSVVHA